MSGIAGVFARDGRPVEVRELVPVMERLAHRGPDGSGVWAEGFIALGHQALWNTPEAVHEKLPLVRQEGPFAITADARIDNRDELLPALGLTDRPVREIGDGEVILRAYQRWGSNCPEHLVGDFAFAIWDGPQQQLFCARDHFGAKPLLYHLSNTLFVFASEAWPLLMHPAVPKQSNEGRIADFLVDPLEGVDRTSTFFEKIVRLPPAHHLIVRAGGLRMEQYWAPDPEREIRMGSDRAYEEAFSELLIESVESSIRGARSFGVNLSGGIDSASIVAIAKQLVAPEAVRTFSAIAPDASWSSDTQMIHAVVRAGGVQEHLLTPQEFLASFEGLEAWAASVDDPFDAKTAGIQPAVANKARGEGVGVALSGFDGDALFGTDMIVVAEHLRRWRWKRALYEARAFSVPYNRSTLHLLWRGGMRPLLSSLIPQAVLDYHRSARGGRVLEEPLIREAVESSVISDDFARRIDLGGRFETMMQHRFTFSNHSLRSRQAGHYVHPYHAVALERGNRTWARYGMEVRCPLMGKRIAEFVLALPAEQKMRAGQRKWLLRRTVRGLLPDEVVGRTGYDEDMGPTFGRALFAAEGPFLLSALDHADLLRPYVDIDTLERARLAYEADPGNPKPSVPLRDAAVLANWLQRLRIPN